MKLKVTLQIIGLFVLPVLLLLVGVIPVTFRFWVLGIFSLAILALIVAERWSLQSLGLRTDNLRHSLVPYFLFTLVGVVVIVGLAKVLGKHPVNEWWTHVHLLGWFVPISFVQELGFRSWLMPKLETLFKNYWVVIAVNGLLFAFMHTIYPDPLLLLPLGLGAGLGFAVMYHYYPNLYLISLSHMVLNFVTTMHCFFSYAITGC